MDVLSTTQNVGGEGRMAASMALASALAVKGGSPKASGQFRAALLSVLGGGQSVGLRAATVGGPGHHSSAITRVNQGSVAEYDNVGQSTLWKGSTCSAAALTAVLRSRGTAVRIADVMKAMPNAISPELGLVSRQGLVDAATKLGLNAKDDVSSYASLQAATKAGQPVLLDIKNDRFPEGHWIVVTGADQRGVKVVDSSGYAMSAMPIEEFQKSWLGSGIRITSSGGHGPDWPGVQPSRDRLKELPWTS